MTDLPEEAKAAIADAIRIVREDKFEAFVRGKMAPPEGDPKAPPPPPKPDPPVKTAKKKAIWWPTDEPDETDPPVVDPPVPTP